MEILQITGLWISGVGVGLAIASLVTGEERLNMPWGMLLTLSGFVLVAVDYLCK